MKRKILMLTMIMVCLFVSSCGIGETKTATDMTDQLLEESLPDAGKTDTAEVETADIADVSAIPDEDAYIAYNPEKDEYYDTRFLAWNAEREDYDYLSPDGDDYRRPSAEDAFAEIPYAGTEPAALTEAFLAYERAIQAYWDEQTEKDPSFALRSFVPYEDDKGSYQSMCTACVPYWEDLFQIAASDGDDRNKAQTAVNGILLNGGFSQRKAGYYLDRMQKQYTDAADAVTALGESITAEDCAELQEQYGYLIAPALQDMGKLDLLQIDPESPCTDAEQLAECARYFA